MKVFNKDFLHHVSVFFFIATACCGFLSPVVVNNFIDPVPVFTARGSSISLLPKKIEEPASLFSLSVSPYTQIIKSCYNDSSVETNQLGDRVGPWGMGAMARNVIQNPGASSSAQVPVYGDATKFPIFWGQAKERLSVLNAIIFTKKTDLFYSVDFEYEKVGIRSEFACEPAEGFVVSLQGGICDHKASTPKYVRPADGTPYPETSEASSADPTTANFMWNEIREIMLGELGMDAKGYQNIELDDITLQVAAYAPITFENDPSSVVRLVPRLTLGVIIPADGLFKKAVSTTAKDNVLKMLVPLGNDGFTGFLMETAVGLDFKDTINLTVAGGYTIFKERSIAGYRVPNNEFQCILYPFTQNVSKKRGGTWHLSASMYAQDFIQGMQCFLDYSWIVHRRDTITLDTVANLPIFEKGLPVLERTSEFRVGTAHLGLVYKMAKNVEAGASVQVVLHGFQAFKPYTFMGTLSVIF